MAESRKLPFPSRSAEAEPQRDAGAPAPASLAPLPFLPQSPGRRRSLRAMLDDYERRLILLALDAAGGNQRRAAASLGLLPSTLSEKMKRLGLRVQRSGWGVAPPEGLSL